MKYTKNTLKKLEDLFGELEYRIRYERGTFKSGYCIVEKRRMIIINKFYDTESRINCLLEILGSVEVDLEALSDSGLTFYGKISKSISLTEKQKETEETE